jgi:hypothetical protein
LKTPSPPLRSGEEICSYTLISISEPGRSGRAGGLSPPEGEGWIGALWAGAMGAETSATARMGATAAVGAEGAAAPALPRAAVKKARWAARASGLRACAAVEGAVGAGVCERGLMGGTGCNCG